MSQAIDGAVGEGCASLHELHQFDPALNSDLRVAKQIDRFTQLGIHLGKPERSAGATTSSTKKRTSSQAKKARLDTHSPAPAKAALRRK